MKLKYAVSVMIVVLVATTVAAAMAQQPRPQFPQREQSDSDARRGSDSADSAPDVAPNSFHPFRSSSISSTGPGFNYGQPLAGLFHTEDAGLAKEAGTLIRKLEAAESDTARNEIKAQLSANLGKQFDSRQKRHEQEIKALEAKVKKLKELVNKRQESREEIISRRLDQILRDSQGLGW